MGNGRRGIGRGRGTLRVGAVLVAGLLTLGGVGPAGAGQQALDPFAGVDLPPALGQTELAVYVPATGHTVGGAMLDYWRATGASTVYGPPISEPYVADGVYRQAFENAIFEFDAQAVWTVDPFVRLQPLGRTALGQRVGEVRDDGRRAAGGGDRRGAAWRPLNPKGPTVARVRRAGGTIAAGTGHSITGAALAWYDAHEGALYLGAPLSEPVRERGITLQWFEGGALAIGEDGASLLPLARESAADLAIDMSPVDGSDLPVYNELLFWTADSPSRVGPVDAPGPKRIEVSIAEQRLWAYQGETLVLETLVSTGIDPNGTDTGRFRVRYKVPLEDMRGLTDTEGEVIWVAGDEGEPPLQGIPYGVDQVPNTMYFNLEAEALHGAYWHSNFGVPMSHGCVNLPLDVATFLFGWAPLGTPVWVHE